MIRNGEVLSPEESVALLADTFFPDDRTEEDSPEQDRMQRRAETSGEQGTGDLKDPPFTKAELVSAV